MTDYSELVKRLRGDCGFMFNTDGWDAAAAIETLQSQVEQLTRERDAAFKMSRCECGPDECCANLVKGQIELAAAKARISQLEAALQWIVSGINDSLWPHYMTASAGEIREELKRARAALGDKP